MPTEMFTVLGVLLGAGIVGCLVASGLYLASIAIYNKCCTTENQVEQSSFGFSLLAGFLSVGGFFSAYIVASILSSLLLFTAVSSGPPSRSGPSFDPTMMILVGVGVVLAMLGVTYAVKALIARMLIPCDFATASIIAALWLAMDTAFWVAGGAVIGIMLSTPYFSALWP